jgi:hypothetical protein
LPASNAPAGSSRRHLNSGQRAMATAVIYPEPEKAGRKKAGELSSQKTISRDLLYKARTILETEFVTPSPTR